MIATGARAPAHGEFLDTTNFACLAICEVIDLGIKKHGPSIWTVAEEKHVVTRFFIVYPPGTNCQKGMVCSYFPFFFVLNTSLQRKLPKPSPRTSSQR